MNRRAFATMLAGTAVAASLKTAAAAGGARGFIAVQDAVLYQHPDNMTPLLLMDKDVPVDILFGPYQGLYEIRYDGTDGWIWAEELVQDNDTRVDVPSSTASTAAGGSGVIMTPVYYVQQRNLSCEYSATCSATAMVGAGVSEYELEAWCGYDENPHVAYRGDINGWWGNTVDYGIYNEPLEAALHAYGYGATAWYGDDAQLIAELDAYRPVVVWLGMWGDQGYYDYDANGSRYYVTAGMHCVTAYGYDDGGVYVMDPAHGSSVYWDWGTFNWMWQVLDGMALSVW